MEITSQILLTKDLCYHQYFSLAAIALATAEVDFAEMIVGLNYQGHESGLTLVLDYKTKLNA